jgi:hypothetical protein
VALKAQAKQVERDRVREAKQERDEAAKQLQLAVAGAVKDITNKINDASRATVAAVGNALAASVAKVSLTMPKLCICVG